MLTSDSNVKELKGQDNRPLGLRLQEAVTAVRLAALNEEFAAVEEMLWAAVEEGWSSVEVRVPIVQERHFTYWLNTHKIRTRVYTVHPENNWIQYTVLLSY